MLNSCLEKYSIVYQFQNLVLKNTRSIRILLPRMGLSSGEQTEQALLIKCRLEGVWGCPKLQRKEGNPMQILNGWIHKHTGRRIHIHIQKPGCVIGPV